MKRIHVIIQGVVQGIGFRHYICTKANLLGIKGWVRNLDNDKVEAVFESSKDKIKQILEYCIKGHYPAKVKDIKIMEEEFKSEKDFRII